MSEPVLYKIGRKNGLWATLTPTAGLRQTWQLAISTRGRGGAKLVAPLLETGPLRPLATVTIKGEAFPLTIDWHEQKRGGVLGFGGERKLGTDGGLLSWEMRWVPLAGAEGTFKVEMRLRTTPRRIGSLRIDLPTPLYQPEVWAIPEAEGRGHRAVCARSGYSAHFVALTTESGEAGWEEGGGFSADLPMFSLGGGKLVAFCLGFGAAPALADARSALVAQYAAHAAADLHPPVALTKLDPVSVVSRLIAPAAYAVQGMERLYLKSPLASEEGSFYAGFPHEPAGALKSLSDWNRLRATPEVPRLLRFGAGGICADFQVMGQEGQAEPNKGAFWDKMTLGMGTDYADGATHGLLSNARLARHLFLLHAAGGEPLLKQSALNICQWLLLKQNETGFYSGARYHATRGLTGDGKVLPQPCALDGVEAIRAFVLAYAATRVEVWIKAAWKVAQSLLDDRAGEFEERSPVAVAGVILSLLALDAEAPNADLRAAIREWAAWLRILPLKPDSLALNSDGLHAGLFDCAQAGFALFALTRDLADLRYAFAALHLVPAESRQASWRTIAAHQSALLTLAGLLPSSKLDFATPSVTLDWRVFAPDPAAAPFLRIEPIRGEAVSENEEIWADWLPLVCRGTDQLLLLVLAPPSVDAVTVTKNAKHPLLRNLQTGNEDSTAPLRPLLGESWANVGLFTVDP